MKHSFSVWTGMIALALSAATAIPADAQIGRRLRDAAARAAEREVTRQVEDRVTETVRCAMGDSACAAAAEADGKVVEFVQADGSTAQGATVPHAFVNFDFVPGERVLFTDDFSGDVVGDFPRRLEFISGNMEVAEWSGSRWLRGTSWPGEFYVVLPEALPDRFTVEMEVVPGPDTRHLELFFSDEPEDRVTARYFGRRLEGGIRRGGSDRAAGRTESEIGVGTPFMLRVMADGAYVKVYLDGTRVANAPNANIGRSNRIHVKLPGDVEVPGYIRNIRVAAGGRALYDALAAEGRVATQGIFFDTGSDQIRPESAPTLQEIGRMMQEHPELRLAIEGHTDNVGDPSSNQQLSERRAASVKAHLERQHDIAAGRIEARGLGASRPAASNDTPEGRQQNRRVELVRL